MTDLTSPAIGSTDWGTDVNDNWDALESALSMLESSFISGLGMRYVSSTQVKVLSGGARDAGGSGNIALASPATANITTGANPTGGLAQLNGLDEIDLELAHGITCTVAGSTITASSDVSGHLGTRLGSGQITTSGTAVAGTGTDLLAELAIGDLIGNATNGWARVTKISSNSSLTLAVALPGGNITTAANFSVLENATVKPEGGTKQRVNSLSGAGTAIVVASAPGGSGGALLAGVLVTDCWYAVWVISNGTTPGVLLSSQRTTLLAPPDGYDLARRVGWVRNTGGGLHGFHEYGEGRTRFRQTPAIGLVWGGTATSSTHLTALPSAIPPTARAVQIHTVLYRTTAGGDCYLHTLARNSNTGADITTIGIGNTSNPDSSANTFVIECDDAQGLDYYFWGSTAQASLFSTGYFDAL